MDDWPIAFNSSSRTPRVPKFDHLSRAIPVGALSALALLGPLAAASRAEPPQIQASAALQIQLLMQEKATRTPAQQKISSRFLHEIAKRRGTLTKATLPELRTRAEVQKDGTVFVNLTADVDQRLYDRVKALDGTMIRAYPEMRAARVRLPLEHLEALAELDSVQTIRPTDRYMLQGSTTTEGDVAHGADDARALFSVDGSGVQVGAISDSVEALANLQAAGELPPGVTVLAGQAGTGTSEGTALMEIIHDMAPGADLFFATGTSGFLQDFVDNIADLVAAGCDVIVDDVLYFSEPVFQDGIIADAVDDAAAAGVIYLSSAGNSGNLDSGTSGTWEGFYSGASVPTVLGGMGLMSVHDFGTGTSNRITGDPPSVITLHWGNPQGAASDDYDLFLLNSDLTMVLDSSTNTQNGTQDPYEEILANVVDETDNHLIVAKKSGSDTLIHLSTHRGQLDQATEGETYGHSAAEGSLSIAAVNVATAFGGEFVGGASNPVEPFSSDGPRRMLFDAAGNPLIDESQIRQGDPRKGGPTLPGILRQKPDLAAADGVTTSTPGFNPFFGTSASAPHAAGISALFKELFPGISQLDTFDAFRSSALDIDATGVDRNSGFGILKAENALDPPNVIFADGFESGDATSWTSD